jgi:hypothetical protein
MDIKKYYIKIVLERTTQTTIEHRLILKIPLDIFIKMPEYLKWHYFSSKILIDIVEIKERAKK